MEASNLSQNLNADQQNGNESFSEALIVFFHIDTTDYISTKAEICQIAAWCNGKEFREYILPDGRVDHICKWKNGFSKVGNGKLFHDKKEVQALSAKDGLQEFINFLRGLTESTCNILLAAHNCKSFHRHIILRLLEQYELLPEFKSIVLGFIDTMSVFKSQKLTFSVDDKKKHAVIYVKALVDFIEKSKCYDAIMKQHVELLDELIRFRNLKDNFENILSSEQIWKMAKAGISTDMLKDASSADNDNGVAILLKQGKDGKAELKLTNDTIQKIIDQVKNEHGNSTA